MDKRLLEKNFVDNTLHILENYDGPYGVTLLVNCLLGLIVLPEEKDFNHINERSGIHFHDLGIRDEDIRSWGNIAEEKRTASRFLRSMRNSVAHIRIDSISENGEIRSLLFSDNTGFEAVFSVEKLKSIVMKLADYIR